MKRELIHSTILFSLPGMDFQELAKIYSIPLYFVEIRQTIRIFDPFFTTNPPGKGTGLGLPTALAFVEGKEIVGGYLMIKANDLPEAIEIGKNCPIFDYDGIVEVREVQQLQV